MRLSADGTGAVTLDLRGLIRVVIGRCGAVTLLPTTRSGGFVDDWSDNQERISDAQGDVSRAEGSSYRTGPPAR
jgi:hypothetical protein